MKRYNKRVIESSRHIISELEDLTSPESSPELRHSQDGRLPHLKTSALEYDEALESQALILRGSKFTFKRPRKVHRLLWFDVCRGEGNEGAVARGTGHTEAPIAVLLRLKFFSIDSFDTDPEA